jgi:hypothetical protein
LMIIDFCSGSVENISKRFCTKRKVHFNGINEHQQ